MTNLCENRKARFDYEIIETFEAGISLLGTEIKSLRANGGSIAESYISIVRGEAYLKNATIAPYAFGGVAFNHEEKRERKLLLHKREIGTLHKAIQEKGLTVIPLSIYLKKGRAKLKI
ncbi:MAG: SsrA-binding protein SmpB, partial [Chlamydiia bacterium]|nr:SsrA-binding protein SmpB [Chlamydiia bacterium]